MSAKQTPGSVGTVYIDLHSGECGFQSASTEADCPFSARYFVVNEQTGGIVGACGHHVPDLWLDDDFGGLVFDAHDIVCEKWLERHEEPSSLRGNVDGSALPTVHEECEYRARVLIVDLGETDNDPYGACGYHARQTWVREATQQDDE